MIHDPVLEYECAHAWPLTRIGVYIGTAHGCEFRGRNFMLSQLRLYTRFFCLGLTCCCLALIVVFNATLTLLLLGKPDVKIEVKVVIERRCPRECPLHTPFVLLQLSERRPRHRR